MRTLPPAPDRIHLQRVDPRSCVHEWEEFTTTGDYVFIRTELPSRVDRWRWVERPTPAFRCRLCDLRGTILVTVEDR